ncbi:hypothetical protein C8Q80DRAFT_108627 [Daedaleopsis nitida]|nr:hypothetical protein C8Q80DRAFT_108627 [Daedaleopsis nitida]
MDVYRAVFTSMTMQMPTDRGRGGESGGWIQNREWEMGKGRGRGRGNFDSSHDHIQTEWRYEHNSATWGGHTRTETRRSTQGKVREREGKGEVREERRTRGRGRRAKRGISSSGERGRTPTAKPESATPPQDRKKQWCAEPQSPPGRTR